MYECIFFDSYVCLRWCLTPYKLFRSYHGGHCTYAGVPWLSYTRTDITVFPKHPPYFSFATEVRGKISLGKNKMFQPTIEPTGHEAERLATDVPDYTLMAENNINFETDSRFVWANGRAARIGRTIPVCSIERLPLLEALSFLPNIEWQRR